MAEQPKFKRLEAAKRVELWAVKDLVVEGRVVVKKGESRTYYPVDARELLRGGGWTRERPADALPRQESGAHSSEESLSRALNVPRHTARLLEDHGYATVEELRETTVEKLTEIKGIGGRMAERILDAARGTAIRPEDAQAEADEEAVPEPETQDA